MIGFQVVSIGYDAKRNVIHSPKRIYRFFEGDPAIREKAERKMAEEIIKAVGNKVIRFAAGGPVKGLMTVVNVVTKPLTGLGEAGGQFLAEGFTQIADSFSKNALNLVIVQVVIKGDFDAAYQINTFNDWAKLPILLACIPKSGTTDEFMGESVIESVIWAHRNFLRDDYYKKGKFALEITVKL